MTRCNFCDATNHRSGGKDHDPISTDHRQPSIYPTGRSCHPTYDFKVLGAILRPVLNTGRQNSKLHAGQNDSQKCAYRKHHQINIINGPEYLAMLNTGNPDVSRLQSQHNNAGKCVRGGECHDTTGRVWQPRRKRSS